MYLTRRSAPTITIVCLLIVLFALSIVSVGESFKRVSLQGDSLRSSGTKWKRDGDLLTFPWVWRRSAVDGRDALEDTVVTITVCATVDSLPTVTANLPTTLSAVTQNSATPLGSGLADVSSTNVGPVNGASSYGSFNSGVPVNATLDTAISDNTASSYATSILTAPAYDNSSSAAAFNGGIISSTGLVCHNYPSTAYTTNCSGCLKTSTVTNTYLSTVSNCETTQVSFVAVFTVTVTANFSASAAPFFANSSSELIPSKSLQENPSPSLVTGSLFSSLTSCPNETFAKGSKDCVPSSNTVTPISSSQTPTIATAFGSVPSSTEFTLTLQTLAYSALNTGGLGNSTFTGQGGVHTVISFTGSLTNGTAVVTNSLPNEGLSTPALSSDYVTSPISFPATVFSSGNPAETVTSGLTNSLRIASYISLSGVSSAEILLSSRISFSQQETPSISVKVTAQDQVSSFTISINSITSQIFPVISASSDLLSTVPTETDIIISSSISLPPFIQGVLPGIKSGATAFVSSALPSITAAQGFASSVDSAASSLIPEISSAQVLISSAVSDFTAAVGSVLPIITSISSALNGIINNADSVSGAGLSLITATQALGLSAVSDATVVAPHTNSAGTALSSASKSINAIATSVLDSVQSLARSIESDTMIVRLTPTVSLPTLLRSMPSNINLGTIPVLSSGQSSVSSIVSDANALVLPPTSSVSVALDSVLSGVNPTLRTGLATLQSLTSGVISNAVAISPPLFPSATTVVNSVYSNENSVHASSVPSVVKNIGNSANSISLSVMASLLSAPDGGTGGGNILASIIRPVTSTIPSIVSTIPNVLGEAVGGGLVRDDVPNTITITQIVSSATGFKPSITLIPML